ncbi:MAG: hypothetical protein R6V17_00440 [Halanaerobacter sp.]
MNAILTKKQSKLLIVLTLIISLVGLVGCSDDDSGPKKYDLSGTVVSNDGYALEGIGVKAGGNTTVTGPNGEWNLTGVEEGKVVEVANNSNYTFDAAHEVTADQEGLKFKAKENKEQDDEDDEEEPVEEELQVESAQAVDKQTIELNLVKQLMLWEPIILQCRMLK